MPPSTDASAGPFDAWRLADRVCVVTGGASGIGLATARAFALAGGRVQLLDRNEAAGKTAVQAMADEGLKARFEAIDVTREADVDTAFERIASQEGRIDVLVNSAGIAIRRPAVDLKLSDWNAVIDVNLTGVFLCSRAAARHMIPRASGAIVSLSSEYVGIDAGGVPPRRGRAHRRRLPAADAHGNARTRGLRLRVPLAPDNLVRRLSVRLQECRGRHGYLGRFAT